MKCTFKKVNDPFVLKNRLLKNNKIEKLIIIKCFCGSFHILPISRFKNFLFEYILHFKSLKIFNGVEKQIRDRDFNFLISTSAIGFITFDYFDFNEFKRCPLLDFNPFKKNV